MARRRRTWIDTNIDEVLGVGAVITKQLVPSSFPDDTKGLTIVRMILHLDILPIVVNTAGSANHVRMGYGIGILSDEAVAGGAALPSPLLQVQEPVTGWMLRNTRVVAESNDSPAYYQQVDLDLRAQRKMMYGTPQLLLEAEGFILAAFTLTVSGFMRMLVLQA